VYWGASYQMQAVYMVAHRLTSEFPPRYACAMFPYNSPHYTPNTRPSSLSRLGCAMTKGAGKRGCPSPSHSHTHTHTHHDARMPR
jgi:hypothetical protein